MPTQISGEITLETTKLKAKLAEATAELRKFKQQSEREGAGLGKAFFGGLEKSGIKEVLMGAIGGGTLVGAAEMVRGVAEEYARLYDNAAKFSVAPDSMQRLSVMARRTGTDVAAVAGSLRGLTKTLEDGSNEQIRQSLKGLQMNAGDLIGASPEQQLAKLAPALQALKAAGGDVRTTMENLGLAEMIPLLLQYEEHAKAAASVEIIKEEELKKMKEAIESFDTLIMKAKAFIGVQASRGGAGGLAGVASMGLSNIAHDMANVMQGKLPDSAFANLFKPRNSAAKEAFARMSGGGASPASADNDAMDQGNANLQGAIDRRSYAMRNPLEKSKSFLDDFAKAAGVDATSITSATQMREIMRDLKKQVDSARSRGDRVAENAGLTKLNDAQAAAQAFAGSDVGDRKVPMGRLGSDINRLLGKSGSELISDRVAEGNTILGKMESHLRALSSARNGGAQSIWLGGSDPRAFTF